MAIKQFGLFELDAKLFINTIPEMLLQQDYQHGLTLGFIKKAGLPADKVVNEPPTSHRTQERINPFMA